jgi:hypothetical protein
MIANAADDQRTITAPENDRKTVTAADEDQGTITAALTRRVQTLIEKRDDRGFGKRSPSKDSEPSGFFRVWVRISFELVEPCHQSNDFCISRRVNFLACILVCGRKELCAF